MDVWIERLNEALVNWGPSVAAALAILVVGWILAKFIRGLVRRGLRRADVDETLVGFIGNVIYMAAIALVVIATLGRLGINTASFAAVLAAAGLAIGLALQNSLSNFASGVMLMFFRPFEAGDFIEAGGVSGSVDTVQMFTTTLKTPDNRTVIVPNSQVTAGSITNYSSNDTRRVDLVFGIAYADDMRRAKEVIEGVLAAETRVLRDPAPTVAVSELADSSVNLVCRPWVATGDYWAVYFDLTEAIKGAFDEAGLSIPFPQTDVHVIPSASEAA